MPSAEFGAGHFRRRDGAREQELGRIRLMRHGEVERSRRRCGPEQDMEGDIVTRRSARAKHKYKIQQGMELPHTFSTTGSERVWPMMMVWGTGEATGQQRDNQQEWGRGFGWDSVEPSVVLGPRLSFSSALALAFSNDGRVENKCFRASGISQGRCTSLLTGRVVVGSWFFCFQVCLSLPVGSRRFQFQ